MKHYKTFEELKQAVKDGILVNWQNGLYYVKIDFEGDFVIKCTSSPMQERLNEKHDLNNFFTQNKSYPFNEGDDYWTIEENQIIWSCWDNISEEIFDENPTQKYFKTEQEAINYLNN